MYVKNTPKYYKIVLRRDNDKFIVKPECEILDGKIFKFWKGFEIEEGIYKGEFSMIPCDIPQKDFPCCYIANGDLIPMEE